MQKHTMEVYTPISTKMFKHRSFIVLSIVLIFAGRKDAVRLRLDQTPTKQNKECFLLNTTGSIATIDNGDGSVFLRGKKMTEAYLFSVSIFNLLL